MRKDAKIAAHLLMGYWCALLRLGRPVPKYLWRHLKVAQDIAERGGTHAGPLAIYEMVSMAIKLEQEAFAKTQSRGQNQ